jgi:apolipoprotein N-acyltransferase
LAYGGHRLAEQRTIRQVQAESPPDLRVALLQESVATIFDYDRERSIDTFQRYLRLAEVAVAQRERVDLVVWPESAFNSVQPVFEFTADARPPAESNWTAEEFELRKQQMVRPAQVKAQGAAYRLGGRTAMLVGTDVYVMGQQHEHFNSAALYAPDGELLDRYGKMHRVMFGEYIPLGERIPWLYQITPMGSGLTPGPRAEAFEVQGVKLAPSICFESVVPHLIQSHVKQLAARGQTPDVLVNITNDGWFKGSSILDLHHRCSVFRAVENRRPMLVAANIGITAEIDASGTVRQRLPRYAVDALHVDLYRSGRPLSFYTMWGDWAAGLCLLLTLAMAGVGLIGHFRGR